jgi:hypothetical protein
VDKVALEQVFSEYFGFPSHFFFFHILHTRLSSKAGKIGPIVTYLINKWTPAHFTPRKEKQTKRKKSEAKTIIAIKAKP